MYIYVHYNNSIYCIYYTCIWLYTVVVYKIYTLLGCKHLQYDLKMTVKLYNDDWPSVIQLSYDSLSICVYMHSYVIMYGDIQYILYSFVTPTCLHHVNNYNWRMNIYSRFSCDPVAYVYYIFVLNSLWSSIHTFIDNCAYCHILISCIATITTTYVELLLTLSHTSVVLRPKMHTMMLLHC